MNECRRTFIHISTFFKACLALMSLIIFTSCFENPLGSDLTTEIDVLPGLTPTLVSVAPASIANDNNPVFTGSTLANASVVVFSDSSCTTPVDTASANASGSFTFTQAVLDDSVNSYYLLATDTSGNESNCSDAFTFTEDSTAPVDPTVLTSSPLLKSENLSPSISGLAEASSTVNIYDDVACSNQVGSGTATVLGTFSVTATVTADQVSTLYADSVDVAGNVSGCSATSVSYEGYTIANNMAVFSSTQVVSGVDINTAIADAMEFDGYWDETYFDFNTAVPEDIEVLVAGDYLISLTLPTTSAVQRSVIHAQAYVNGLPVQGAVGSSSYIRNSGGHAEGSNHFSIMLNGLSANDTVSIYVEREALTGIVTVYEEATVVMEYLSPARDIFFGTATQVISGTDISTVALDSLEFTEVRKDGSYTHDDITNPNDITLAAGDYLVAVNVPMESAVQRANVRIEVHLDDVKVLGAEGQQAYIRNQNGHNRASSHFTGLVEGVTNGQVLEIKLIEEGTSGVVNVETGEVASVFIENVDTTNDILFVSGNTLVSGANFNPGAKSSIQWTNNPIKDAGFYTHNTGVSSEDITLAAGDYLLVYNDTVNSAVQRSNNRITVELDGTEVDGAVCSSHYIRNGSAHTESSCSLVYFLRNVQAGQILNISSQQEAAAGTVNFNDDALLMLWKKD
jgi:hypothetical protein